MSALRATACGFSTLVVARLPCRSVWTALVQPAAVGNIARFEMRRRHHDRRARHGAAACRARRANGVGGSRVLE